MIVTNWKDIQVKETPHKVDVRPLYDKPDAQAVHILLQPGEQLKPHITPVDVFFFVIEGTPTIQVGDQMTEVPENALVESPKDIIHCLYNKSERQARILVVKTPKPDRGARLL
ncbi:MAG: cupin domain-containing protein [Bacteroidales bacterium]|nr:cupin domain-containing protein [Bacteroidales bacterium]